MAMVRNLTTGGPSRISGPTPNPGDGAGIPQMPAVMHATIGHEQDPDEPPDLTTAYWFLRGGQAYVECTLQPSGGQVVARVNAADSYEPFKFGDRVTLIACNGDPNASMIIGKLHDDNDPMPSSVAGVPVEGAVFDPETNARFARTVQYLQGSPGTVMAFESREADMILHSGFGINVSAPDGWIVMNGQHVVLGAPVQSPSQPGAIIGEEMTPSAPFLPPLSVPHTTGTTPPYDGLRDSIVRAQDKFQATNVTDPTFFAYLTALDAIITAIAGMPELVAVAPGLTALLTTFQAVPKPAGITCEAMSASQTCEAF